MFLIFFFEQKRRKLNEKNCKRKLKENLWRKICKNCKREKIVSFSTLSSTHVPYAAYAVVVYVNFSFLCFMYYVVFRFVCCCCYHIQFTEFENNYFAISLQHIN